MNEEERQTKLANLAECKAVGEKAYDAMYKAHSFRDANHCYRDAKDALYDAIGLAEHLGLTDERNLIQKRLEHIKAVFRGQFSG